MADKPTYEELEERVKELEKVTVENKRIEEAIRIERQRLYSILDLFPGLVYLQAPDYSIRYANRSFIEQYGEPNGKLCYEAMWNLKAPCDNCPTFKVFDTKKTEVWESKNPSNGLTCLNFNYPFTDIDGSPLVLEISLDISKHRNNESELKGIVTVCSSCRQVDEGKERWIPIEAFISKRSDILFSHGVCHTCAKELYGFE